MIACVFLVLLTGLSSPALSQSAEDVKLFQEEKGSFLVGIGLDYGLIGFRGKYRVHKNLNAAASLGVLPGPVVFWNIGVEANLNPNLVKRISPYISANFGANAWATLESFEGIEELRVIEGFNIGIGTHIRLSKHSNSYFAIGMSYRIISPESDRFVEEFNETYGTIYNSLTYRQLLPNIGLAFRVWE